MSSKNVIKVKLIMLFKFRSTFVIYFEALLSQYVMNWLFKFKITITGNILCSKNYFSDSNVSFWPVLISCNTFHSFNLCMSSYLRHISGKMHLVGFYFYLLHQHHPFSGGGSFNHLYLILICLKLYYLVFSCPITFYFSSSKPCSFLYFHDLSLLPLLTYCLEFFALWFYLLLYGS